MIKKLRRRFVRVAMLSVILVLVIIMGTINIFNYRSVIRDADALLDVLAENGGSFEGLFPGGPGMNAPGEAPDGQLPPDAEEAADRPGAETRPERPASDELRPLQEKDRRNLFSEETPFESRFFTVTLDAAGTVLSTNITNIAAVSEEEATAFAADVIAGVKTRGFCESYRYLVKTGNGTAFSDAADNADAVDGNDTSVVSTVVFLDCQRSLANARRFLLISILVSAVGAAAVLLLVILFSRRVTRPIQESYEKQREFITNASHDLKTPLTIIDADVSVMEMETGTNEWLEDVKTQTQRLTTLTNDLVYLSRMEEGSTPQPAIAFPISDVIAEEAQGFRTRASVDEKTLVCDIAPSLAYCGDEKSIRQLASILLDNALKYSPKGGEICVRLQQKGKGVEFSVCNTAENLDADHLDRLFERFYRGDASRNSSAGGFGLGLSVARAIVSAHKGRIGATSPDGKSICITAVFP